MMQNIDTLDEDQIKTLCRYFGIKAVKEQSKKEPYVRFYTVK
jgi:hypothetical protein